MNDAISGITSATAVAATQPSRSSGTTPSVPERSEVAVALQPERPAAPPELRVSAAEQVQRLEDTAQRLRENLSSMQARGFLRQVKLDIRLDGSHMRIKVLDAKTDKVLREIPPEGVVEFERKLQDSPGMLLEKTA